MFERTQWSAQIQENEDSVSNFIVYLSLKFQDNCDLSPGRMIRLDNVPFSQLTDRTAFQQKQLEHAF